MKKRPVNLDLRTISFPITAKASILHRVSGVISFCVVGIFLRLLDISLSSSEGFLHVIAIMNNYLFKFFTWGILTVLIYHVVGGVRHILIDFGCLKQTFKGGKISASISFLITFLLSLFVGVFVW